MRRKMDKLLPQLSLAYQGAPDGGVSGEMDMPTWWTGTNCRTVALPPVRLAIPIILMFYNTVLITVLLFNKLARCPYMVRKPLLSVIRP